MFADIDECTIGTDNCAATQQQLVPILLEVLLVDATLVIQGME